MKKITTIILIFILTLSIAVMFTGCANMPQDIPTDETFDESNWEVTFLDQFEGDKLDNTRWRIFTGERPNNPTPKHIHRGGYYSSDDDILYVKDGNLYISTKYKNGQYGEGWYSSWIETSTGEKSRAFDPTPDNYVGFAQKQGYFEIKCIVPPAEGLWSAFWLLPNEGTALSKDDVQWTATDGCEVDIMESPYFFKKKNWVQHVIHSDYGGGHGPRSDKSPIFNVKDMYSTYHTYGLEWDEDTFTFYIDGYKTYSTKNIFEDKILGTPNVPECLILSVEVAGSRKDDKPVPGYEKDGSKSWCGNIDKMDKTKSYDFIVDYIKVMKRK